MSGVTALFVANTLRQVASRDFLLENGANPLTSDELQNLEKSAIKDLLRAAEKGRLSVVQEIVSFYPDMVNKKVRKTIETDLTVICFETLSQCVHLICL